MKDGFHKIDYQGKVGKARKPKELMYQINLFVQGWGHSKYKNKWDWRDDRSQIQFYKTFRTQVFLQVCLIMIIYNTM